MEDSHETLNTVPKLSSFIKYIKQRLKIVFVIIIIILSIAGLAFIVNFIESKSTLGFTFVSDASNLPKMYSLSGHNRVFDRYKGNVDVTVNIFGGEIRTINVPIITVGEIIAMYRAEEYNAGKVEANVPAKTIIEQNMTIYINEVEFEEITRFAQRDYPTLFNNVETIAKGDTVVTQDGENAQLEQVIRQKYLNGEFYSEEIIDEKILEEAVPEIVQRGVGGKFNGTPFSYYLDMKASAYGFDMGFGGGEEFTATEKKAEYGIIAVDPLVIPLGSTVYIESDYISGIFYAEDIGSAIVGNRIDIHLGGDYEAQKEFGIRDIRVYILER